MCLTVDPWLFNFTRCAGRWGFLLGDKVERWQGEACFSRDELDFVFCSASHLMGGDADADPGVVGWSDARRESV